MRQTYLFTINHYLVNSSICRMLFHLIIFHTLGRRQTFSLIFWRLPPSFFFIFGRINIWICFGLSWWKYFQWITGTCTNRRRIIWPKRNHGMIIQQWAWVWVLMIQIEFKYIFQFWLSWFQFCLCQQTKEILEKTVRFLQKIYENLTGFRFIENNTEAFISNRCK